MISTKTIVYKISKELEALSIGAKIQLQEDCLYVSTTNFTIVFYLNKYRTVTEAVEDVICTVSRELNKDFTKSTNFGKEQLECVFPRLTTKKKPTRVTGSWGDLFVEFYYVVNDTRYYVTERRLLKAGIEKEELAKRAFANIYNYCIHNARFFELDSFRASLELPPKYDASSFLCSTGTLKFIADYYKKDIKVLVVDNTLIIDTSAKTNLKAIKRYTSACKSETSSLGVFKFVRNAERLVRM